MRIKDLPSNHFKDALSKNVGKPEKRIRKMRVKRIYILSFHSRLRGPGPLVKNKHTYKVCSF